MHELDWLEEYVDGDGYTAPFYEEDDETTDGGTKKVQTVLKSIKTKIGEIIDKIIAKIKEIANAVKLKYAQVHFKATLKKLGKTYKKQIKDYDIATPFMKLVNAYMKDVTKASAEIAALFVKYCSGKMSFEEYDTKVATIEEMQAARNMRYGNEADRIYEASGDKMKEKLGNAGDILTMYESAISRITSMHQQASADAAKALERAKKAPITPNTPENASTAASKAASTNSSIYSKFSSFVNSILGKLTGRGDKLMRNAANVSSEPVEESWGFDETTMEEAWLDDLDGVLAEVELTTF